jgi:flagellar basal body-associated protein FliL
VSESTPTRVAVTTVVLLAIGIAAAVWIPRWWERRMYHEEEAVAGAGARLLPGSITDARRKIDPGRSGKSVEEALGKASFAVRTEGTSVREIWTYYYEDGTLTVNLTDGMVQRIGVVYGKPKIPIRRKT